MARSAIGTIVALMLSAGCGTIGSPVAPETVGVRGKIERERARQPPPSLPGEQPAMQPESTGPEDVISSRPTGDAMIRSR